MKKYFTISVAVLIIFTACKKEPSFQSSKANATIASDEILAADTIKIPLTELGSGTYYGYTGGLYPGGVNTPSGTYAKDLKKAANTIVLLDTAGGPAANGVIGFISLGASNLSKMFLQLETLSVGNPAVNQKIVMANCTGGSEYIEQVKDSTSGYWPIVERKLRDNNITAKQVEVITLETDDSTANIAFPSKPLYLKSNFAEAVRLFHIKFPNLKIVYFIGRTTTFVGKGKKQQNSEPIPYYNGWACKWLIEDQINNDPGLAYKGRQAVAPMVTWGWYKWSIGKVTRSDGFLWTKDDTTDGLHPTDDGAVKLATFYQNFLLSDPIASIWYGNNGQ